MWFDKPDIWFDNIHVRNIYIYICTLHIVICLHVVNVYASTVSIAFYTGETYRVTNCGASAMHAYVMVTLCRKCLHGSSPIVILSLA